MKMFCNYNIPSFHLMHLEHYVTASNKLSFKIHLRRQYWLLNINYEPSGKFTCGKLFAGLEVDVYVEYNQEDEPVGWLASC